MESPFRSEEAAFRFLLITIGAFALIVVASWISPVLGFLTFLALSAAAVAVYLRQRGPAPEQAHVEHGIFRAKLAKDEDHQCRDGRGGKCDVCAIDRGDEEQHGHAEQRAAREIER